MDNGAFRAWQRGYPFQRWAFDQQMRETFSSGIDLEWFVCPDIVAGGKRSLAFSIEWLRCELRTAPSVALAVQDGMSIQDIKDACIMSRFPNVSHIFVGGTEDWKWETAGDWVEFAHANGRKCHIGRCGTLDHLRAAERVGADSVDSTSWARNDSWHIVEEFLGKTQTELF